MPMEVRYRANEGYLLVKACGQWDKAEAKEEIEAIRDEANKRGQTRLLLDARDLLPPTSEMTRFYTGVHIAKILPHPFKVAAFADPEINRFAEHTAVNRGANFAVFTEEKAAIEWLLHEG